MPGAFSFLDDLFVKTGTAPLVTLFAVAASITGATAAERLCRPPAPPNGISLAARLNPDVDEQQQYQRAVRASYEALLAAGAPEKLACAAALNPEVTSLSRADLFRPQTSVAVGSRAGLVPNLIITLSASPL